MAARSSRLWKPLRIFSAHIWLFAAAAVGIGVALLLPGAWPLPSRMLVGWNVGVALFLAHAFFIIVGFDLGHVRERAAQQDEGAVLMLVLTVAATVASMAAIVAELGYAQDASGAGQAFYFAHAALTILLSWTFIHIIFAFHYAHEFFGEGRASAGGLNFPGRSQPAYWDFVYLAFSISMTFGVTDVRISSSVIRRVVTVHAAISFFFNVAVMALAVSIGSDLIKGGE